MVAPETQLLLSLLHESGDEMGVNQMRVLIIRLGNELGAAQQAAGVTDRDFQRIEAKCATPAGVGCVERRVDAVNKKMWNDVRPAAQQRSGQASGRSVSGDAVADAATGEHVADVGCGREIATLGCGGHGGGGGVVIDHPKNSESTGVVTNPVRLNKRLRKKKLRAEAAVQTAMQVAAAGACAVDALGMGAALVMGAQYLLCDAKIAGVDAVNVDECVLVAALDAAATDVGVARSLAE